MASAQPAAGGGQAVPDGYEPAMEPPFEIPIAPAPKLPSQLMMPQLPQAILVGCRPPARPTIVAPGSAPPTEEPVPDPMAPLAALDAAAQGIPEPTPERASQQVGISQYPNGHSPQVGFVVPPEMAAEAAKLPLLQSRDVGETAAEQTKDVAPASQMKPLVCRGGPRPSGIRPQGLPPTFGQPLAPSTPVPAVAKHPASASSSIPQTQTSTTPTTPGTSPAMLPMASNAPVPPLGMPPAVPPTAPAVRPKAPQKVSTPVAPLGMPPAVPPIAPQPQLGIQQTILPAPLQPASATSKPVQRLGELVGDAAAIEAIAATGRVPMHVLAACTTLAEQAVRMGIDYASLGLGWDHPMTRMQYRQAQHNSILNPASRQRAEQSQIRIKDIMAIIVRGEIDAEEAVRRLFLVEIGVPLDSPAACAASFDGTMAALDAELLLPLRALNEGQQFMHRTYSGEPVPPAKIAEVVQAIISAVLSQPGGFSSWRYNNPVGMRQLEGLSDKQVGAWQEPTALCHERHLRTHEDSDSELGFFWATKIGGPSHGFDFEAQCLLPLLANARHKVILISDPAYPAHPCGRAHFRLLWTANIDGTPAPNPEPRLWLEAVHIDFDAARIVQREGYVGAVLKHVVAKSEAMEVPVLIDTKLTEQANQVGHDFRAGGRVFYTTECLLLRPSNGVCEASDYLSKRHDWVQLQSEVTMPLARALYVPSMLTEVFRGRVQRDSAK